MNIQPINSYTHSNIVNHPTFRDIDGADLSWQAKTPYQRDMEALDNIFYTRMQNLRKKFIDSKQLAKELDKLWMQKESAEKHVKEYYGIVKKRNILQKLFNLK